MVLTRATRLERALSALLLALPLLALAGQAAWRRADRALDVTLCCERSVDLYGLPFDPWQRVALDGQPNLVPSAWWEPHERLEVVLVRQALACEEEARRLPAEAARWRAQAEWLHAAARGHAWNADLLHRRGGEPGGTPLAYSLGPDQRDDLGGGDDVLLLRRFPPDLRLVAWDWLPWLGCAGAALLGAGLLVARAPLLPARARAELEALLALPLAGVGLLLALSLAWLIERRWPGTAPPTHPLRELLPSGLPLAPELSLALAALGLLWVEVALLRLERRWRADAARAALTT